MIPTIQANVRALRRALPHGHVLPERSWRTRHRAVVAIVAAHVPLLVAAAILTGHSIGHGALHAVPATVLGLLAARLPGRRGPTAAATLALLTCSATLVHSTDGLTESHFHFFVMMTILAFYEDWTPYGLAVAYVVLHHGIAGVILPDVRVFDHAGATHGFAAAKWVALHVAFIAASAVANLMLWRSNERSRVRAATLARSLAPTDLPELGDARAAAWHLPGDGQAGGDWLDVVTLPDGPILVTLGDVIGHGPSVAGCAARLRYTARAYAEDGWSPSAILRRLDRTTGRIAATALVAIIDPERETLVCARAGHLPPLVRLPDGRTRLLEDAGGPILADLGVEHRETTVPFPAGSTLVTYSDGLVERRGESIDAGLARLHEVVDASTGTPADLTATVPAALRSCASTDDVALVAVQTLARV